jgi:hypothetical protein
MIKYRLKCGTGHEFEAWFASSAAYEMQEAEGQLVCPHCTNTDIERAIMAPRIAKGRKSREHTTGEQQAPHPTNPGDAKSGEVARRQGQNQNGADGPHTMLRTMRTLREKILEKSENVGPRFAEEARKIHHEEAPDRAIHGIATSEEVLELADEGIDVMPIPQLPDDLN